MFGTVILDAYSQEEAEELANAIEDICSSKDSYGWASSGIYCFWNYYTHEILYIGLASDLYIRFRQHNGLTPMKETGCKKHHIQDYFTKHDKLGYTIFVQSALSQPLVSRNKHSHMAFAKEDNATIQDYTSQQGIDDIKRVEGILIEAYRKHTGSYPSWNKIGGSTEGQRRVLKNNINIVKAFSNPQQIEYNPIVSRSSIRELSSTPIYVSFENYLHAARMHVLIHGMDFNSALSFTNKYDRFGWYEHIIAHDYLNKELTI